MTFLMGLNDSYAMLRAQILLMDPLPSIAKVFSIVVQEEHQRAAEASATSIDLVVFSITDTSKTKPNSSPQFHKKENQRSICSHCNIKGHTVDRFYKVHGYPPGYKSRNQTSVSENMVNAKHVNATVVSQPSQSSPNKSDFLSSLNSNQYNQLLEMLQSHLQKANTNSIMVTFAVSHVTGICSLALSFFVSSTDTWIVDLGASRQICHRRDLFCNLHCISGITVSLPTSHRVNVNFVGDVRLSDDLLLCDVLYMAQFNYNIISVSCLLVSLNVSLSFFW